MSHNLIIPDIRILLLVLLCFCISCSNDPAQTTSKIKSSKDSVDPILQDYESPQSKIGFINDSGDVMIQPKFDEARAFQEGLASVNFEGLWGYINKQGKEVISPKYLGSWTFSNQLGRVQSADNRMFGFINSEGDTVIELKYANARDFEGNLAAVEKNNYWGVVSKNGGEVIPPQYDNVEILSRAFVAVQENELWGLYKIGKGIHLQPKFIKIYSLRSNVLRIKDKSGAFAYINLDGENIFDREFQHASDPQEGIFAVCDSPDNCYLLNREEDKVSPQFQNIRPANEGLFIVKRNDQWGVIDAQGRLVIPIRYDLIYNFKEGFAPYLKNGLWGYMSTEGIMTPPAFVLAWPFQNGKARVLTRSGTAIINTNFRIIIPASKGELRDFNEGLAPFKAY